MKVKHVNAAGMAKQKAFDEASSAVPELTAVAKARLGHADEPKQREGKLEGKARQSKA